MRQKKEIPKTQCEKAISKRIAFLYAERTRISEKNGKQACRLVKWNERRTRAEQFTHLSFKNFT